MKLHGVWLGAVVPDVARHHRGRFRRGFDVGFPKGGACRGPEPLRSPNRPRGAPFTVAENRRIGRMGPRGSAENTATGLSRIGPQGPSRPKNTSPDVLSAVARPPRARRGRGRAHDAAARALTSPPRGPDHAKRRGGDHISIVKPFNI